MHSIRETKVLFFSLSFPLTFLSLALKRTKPVRGPIIPRHDWICGQTMKAHSALAIPLPRPPFPPYSPPLQPSYRGTVGRRDRRDRIRIDSSTSVTHTRFNSMLPLRQFKSIESIFSLSLSLPRLRERLLIFFFLIIYLYFYDKQIVYEDKKQKRMKYLSRIYVQLYRGSLPSLLLLINK